MKGKSLHKLVNDFDETTFNDLLDFYTYKEKKKKKNRIKFIKHLRKQEFYNQEDLNKKFLGQDIARIIREMIEVIVDFQIITFPLKTVKSKLHFHLAKATLANKFSCNSKALRELSKAITIVLKTNNSEIFQIILVVSAKIFLNQSFFEFSNNFNPKEKCLTKKNHEILQSMLWNILDEKKQLSIINLEYFKEKSITKKETQFILFVYALKTNQKQLCKLFFTLLKSNLNSQKFDLLKKYNQLFSLIHLLSKNEYINTLLYLKSTKKKDRIAVIEYLKSHQQLEVQKFKSKFKNKDISKICRNLINAIVDYLLLYHKAQNAKQAIHLGLVKANILEEIGLNDIAIKFLEKIEKLSIQIEDHYSRLIICNELVRHYARLKDSKSVNAKQKMLNKNLSELGKETLNFIKLKQIQLKFRTKDKFKSKESILSKSDIELLSDENTFKNKHFKQSQIFFNASYLSRIGKQKESLKCFENLFQLYEKDIANNEFNYFGYISTITNLINKLIKLKELKQVKSLLEKFDLIKEKININPLRKAHYYYRFFNCSFQYHFTTNNHNFILKHEKKCNEIIEELQNQLPIYNTYTLWYFLGIAHFYNKKYNKAQDYFKHLIDAKKIKDRKQIESIAKLLYFVCAIETNKTQNNLVKSVKRNSNLYFKKNNFNYKTDELLLAMLNEICNDGNYNKNPKTAILKNYLPKFKKLQKTETERLKDLGVMQYLG